MSDSTAERQLRDNLEEALDLLHDYALDQAIPESELDPLPSLLEQCEDMCAAFAAARPLRLVHHLACSGGTLISKCLSVMPNVVLLSEIDPLSRMVARTDRPRMFLPTDLIYGARVALRPVDDDTAGAMFRAALGELHTRLDAAGQHLVLRDHAHSQFCSDTAPPERPTLHEMLDDDVPVLSVVTVRHPLDCYLSLIKNGWRHFTPFTLEEYARRHIAFLDRHAGMALFHYEDFVDDPDGVMERICAALALPFVPGGESLISVVAVSGDSGRSSAKISRRPRRALTADIREEIAHSPQYRALCDRLGYEAEGEEVSAAPAD